MTYHISIRRDASGRYGYSITDGRGAKVAGRRGCQSLARAQYTSRGAAERLIHRDRSLGIRSHIETAVPVGDAAYAWQDPHDGLWRVADRDNAGTHRPGVSEACARYEAAAANARDGRT